MFSWLLLVVVVSFALTINYWWLLATVPIGIWKVFQWFFYKGRPWKRVHFPMMRNYAAALGFESIAAKNASRDVDCNRALRQLVQTTLPDIGEEDASAFVTNERLRCASFSDRALLAEFLGHQYGDKSAEVLDEFMSAAKKRLDPSSAWIMVRMVIAGVIELKFGSRQRAEYLYAVLTGKAT